MKTLQGKIKRQLGLKPYDRIGNNPALMDRAVGTSLSVPYRPGTVAAFAKDTLERPDHFFRRFLALPSIFPAGLAVPVTTPWRRQRRRHKGTAFLKPIFRHTKLLGPKNLGGSLPPIRFLVSRSHVLRNIGPFIRI
jgi:hypothetical protein